MRRAPLPILIALAAALAPTPARAQGLPPYLPVNPLLTSRSGVYFQPYLDPKPGWRVRMLLDYASAVEFSSSPNASLVLDGELLRLDATVSRDVGTGFVGAALGLNGVYNGFLDGFLDWYHDLTGLRVTAREVRPRNRFDYAIALPNGDSLTREASSAFLGDLRLFGGLRHSRAWQTVLAVTLPTTTGPTGFGKGATSLSAVTTLRSRPDRRVVVEGSMGLGYTPSHGDLAELQREWFHSASLGARLRFWGKQAAFVNVFYQSSNYQGTTLMPLDQRELTIDYGFLLKARGGPEWFLGMTEDLEPNGPAIDLSFRIGARW
ncbi:MAG: DUF3187 family protein [Gemmatimonadales bacterium]